MENYTKDQLIKGINAGLQVGSSPAYNYDTRSNEIVKILGTITPSPPSERVEDAIRQAAEKHFPFVTEETKEHEGVNVQIRNERMIKEQDAFTLGAKWMQEYRQAQPQPLTAGQDAHYESLLECCNKILDSIDKGKVPQRGIMGLRLLLNRNSIV